MTQTQSGLHQETFEKALALATPTGAVNRPKFVKTFTRALNRRGIMWVGQTCNLRCHFCYYLDRIENPQHPEHGFMSLDKNRRICDTLVEVYHNSSVDIQGGEPTLMRELPELIRHCSAIGLDATVITNAQVLEHRKIVDQYQEAGIRDFLVSIQGLGEIYDQIVGRPGAHIRQMKTLRNLQEAGVAFRTNTVLARQVLPQLPFIAELAIQTGAQVVNFLAFNPFDDQSLAGKRSIEGVPRYSEIFEFLSPALDRLESAGVEANVRYLPLCVAPERHRKVMHNFRQIPYDLHENDFASWSWTGLSPQRETLGELSPPIGFGPRLKTGYLQPVLHHIKKLPAVERALKTAKSRVEHQMASLYQTVHSAQSIEELYQQDARLRAQDHCGYRYVSACATCDVKAICDGFHGDYADLMGEADAHPIKLGHQVTDPIHFIQAQEKSVHPTDFTWLEQARISRPDPQHH